MSKFFSITCFFSFLFSQNYLWPTSSSYVLTSSFAEPRANRFHAGIDISTWNAEGYKCFAIENGYVYRIWTQPYGYGKSLYIKLDDGQIAVYAHLSRYAPKINNYLKKIQKSTKRYNQNIYLKKNKFPVLKGEIIAYTGSTGIGTPHFHFEIRKNMNVNKHTLSFYPNFKDSIAPSPLHLYGIALRQGSILNQSVSFSEIKFTKITNRLYQVDDTIEVTGEVGLAIECIDRTLKRSIATRVDYTELWLDSIRIFYSHFPETSYLENHYLNLDHNLFFKKVMNKRVKNLFLNPKNKLERFYRHQDFGILKNPYLNDTTLNFTIKIRDYKKNETLVKGRIHFSPVQLIILESILSAIPKHLLKKPLFFRDITISDNSDYNFLDISRLDSIRINHKLVQTKTWYPAQENIYRYNSYIFRTAKNTLITKEKVIAYALDKRKFTPSVKYASDIVLFNPIDLFFNGYLNVSLNRPLKKGEAFYEWNQKKKKWEYIAFLSQKKKKFRTRSVDIYTTLIDSISPNIYFLDRKYNMQESIFQIRIKDNLSGIHDENNYTLLFLGKKLVAEYDYEEHLLKIDMSDLRKKGTLSLRIHDNVGNENFKTIRIN